MTVLLPTASDLRRAMTRHLEAVGRDESRSTPETIRAREDSAYTLCVLTGTTGVGDALRVADLLLDRETAPLTRARPAAVRSLPVPASDAAAEADRVALPAAA
ncbi:DUF5133 domain-containing protein [Streptomyces sp. NPDC102406]|uniref:DUF5133 domain-containing protein n=1 Tax=Streptomyces sp. NPDC102406 TaxID=3366171 RepID=UPI00380F27C5